MTAALAEQIGDDDREEQEEERSANDAERDPRYRFWDLRWYMEPLKKHSPLLKSETYLALFDQYRHGTSERDRLDARGALVYGNMRLVIKIALAHRGRGLPLLDLCQEGVFGLLSAIEKFEPERGHRFSTYAVWWIRQAMTRAIMDMDERRPYRIPVHLQECINLVKRTAVELVQRLGRAPHAFETFQEIRAKDSQLAERMKLKDVVRCQRLIFQGYISLDAEISYGTTTITIGDTIEDARRINAETALEAAQLLRKYRAARLRIEKAVQELTDPRQAQILRFRYGLGDFERMTLEQIGERYDLTRERIRQIEVAALASLNATLGITDDQIIEILDVADELERLVASV